MPYQKTAFALFLILALCMLPGVAAAQCTSPNEPEGTIDYFSADKTYKYCDGTNWIDWGGGGGGISGWERVSNAAAGACGPTAVTVNCTGTKKLLGGGCHAQFVSNLRNSYPSADNAWTCMYNDNCGTTTAWAICAD